VKRCFLRNQQVLIARSRVLLEKHIDILLLRKFSPFYYGTRHWSPSQLEGEEGSFVTRSSISVIIKHRHWTIP
jgi:hypothetical protein